MSYNCQTCNKFTSTNKEEIVNHTIGVCCIPENKLEYWRTIAKIAFEDLIKRIGFGSIPHPKNLTLEEIRGLYILQASGMIEVKHLPPQEEMSFLLAEHAPDSIIALMEYAQLIKKNEDGTYSLADFATTSAKESS